MKKDQTEGKSSRVLREGLTEALKPETVKWDTFTVSEAEFKIKPLCYDASVLFRKWAVPIVADRMVPFENLLAGLTKGNSEFSDNFGFLASVVETEERVDRNMINAVAAVCAAQSPLEGKDALDSVDHWAKLAGKELTRKQVLEVFEKQCAIEEEVGQLGKSLRTRLESLGALVGKKIDLPSLLRDLTQRARSSSDRGGAKDSTLPRSAGSSTDAPSITSSIPGSQPAAE